MTKEKFGIILPITLLSYFLILMDNSIIFTSSVEIGESLHLSAQALSWVSSAYTLTFGGCLLLSGRLSDLLGRKTIFLIGLFIFGISSLLIGLAYNATIMIIMRAIQGIGSSIIAPTTLALIMDNYQGTTRQKAIAYYGATAGIGSSVGLLVGGGLTSLISWRAGFLINVPFTIALILLTIKYVKKSSRQQKNIDYLGSFLSLLGLISFIYGLTEKNSIYTLSGIVILYVFIVIENKLKEPILPLSLFKNRVRFGAYVTRLFFMMTMLPFWFFLPQMMQKDYGFSALQSGMAFLPLTIPTFIVALQLPWLIKKLGNNQILLVGEIILLIGFVLLILLDVKNGYRQSIFVPMMVIGIGQGLIMAPVTTAGIYQAPENEAGIASGITNTMHQIGGPIGLALILATTTSFTGILWVLSLFTVISIGVVIIFLLSRN